MRKCIKCGKEEPLGQFDDNWRHKVNVCKDCRRRHKREYNRDIQKRKIKIKGISNGKKG